jgi:protein-disulfide isomerase
LNRLSVRFAGAVTLAALSLPVYQAAAQQDVPADPASFTAATPTKETVSAFLQTNWGFDDSRVWQVQAILKTPVEGVSRVIVLVGDKTGKQKAGQLEFFVLPGGKYILVVGDDSFVPFGEHPYADVRAILQQRADGPYRGSALKDFEIVEFADFQCPHCKDAQANMDKLAVDFPKARIVFQSYPLEGIHPQAKLAAAYGVCVTKEGGSNAFFTFAAAVFEGQEGLATADGATLTLNSAVTKAGLEPAKIATCAATPATLAVVEASKKLAEDLSINQTPMLAVNGRLIPASIAYSSLKQIIQYQAKLDGVGN